MTQRTTTFAYRMLWVQLALFAYTQSSFAATWVAGPAGIENLGEVSKNSPMGTNNLHYNGPNGDPELAVFEIDAEDANDIDCNVDTGETEDAGLCETDTDWTCTGNGAVVDSAYTTTYTPHTAIETNIGISVDVFEGHNRSWASNNYDEEETRTWSESLTTFRVGVVLFGGLATETYYEDDATYPTEWVISLGDSAALSTAMYCSVSPSIWEDPGLVEDAGEFTKELSWTVIAAGPNGNLTNIQKKVIFTPSIDAAGELTSAAATNGLHVPFASSIIGLNLAARSAPAYIAALVSMTFDTSTTCTHSSFAAGINSVIENVAHEGDSKKHQHWHGGHTDPVSTLDLSTLCIGGTELKGVPGEAGTTEGSVDLRTEAKCYDSAWSEMAGCAWYVTSLAADTYVKFGCTKPKYGE